MNTITELNDRFRRGDRTLGQYTMTSGVQALSPELQLQLIRLVQQFDSFTADNDPYAEHDFGKWVERCKSLVKNFERTLPNATAKLNLCFIRLMLKRLANE